MFSNALSVETHSKSGNAAPLNVNFDILFMAVREGSVELEEASDTLLAAAGLLGKEHGIYTEAQLGRKTRNENERAEVVEEHAIPRKTTDYLLERQLDELIDVSKLTALQEICFRLHIEGLNCNETAAALGFSYGKTAGILRTARRRVRAACDEGRYAGWYEVYLSEVNRTRKR